MLSLLGSATSIAGFVLGVVYAIGLIIVTIHLSRYGITSVYLIQTKYVVVGTAYLLHVAGMGFVAAPIALALTYFAGPDVSTYIAGAAGIGGFVMLLLAGYSPLAFERTVHRVTVRKSSGTPTSKTFWTLWYSALFCGFLLCWQTGIRAYILADPFLQTMTAVLTAAVFLSGLVYYIIFLYQAPISVDNPILELIGGGRPIQVRLTIKDEAAGGLVQYGLFEAKDGASKTLRLLDETDQDFLVLIDIDEKERALKISKSVVHSVIYLP